MSPAVGVEGVRGRVDGRVSADCCGGDADGGVGGNVVVADEGALGRCVARHCVAYGWVEAESFEFEVFDEADCI